MCPNHVDPNINYQRIHKLSEEFTELWNQLHALYLDATIGFRFVRDYVVSEQDRVRSFVRGTDVDSEAFQDSRMFTYLRLLPETFVGSGIHDATQGDVKARNDLGGINFTVLGRLCLVSFYDFWNEYLRREYVIAKGYLNREEKDKSVIQACLKKYASFDVWGDIRILRQSIVHNLGTADSDVARCKIFTWFKPGDPISITPDHMRAIFLALLNYRNELFKEQFPEHYISVPRLT